MKPTPMQRGSSALQTITFANLLARDFATRENVVAPWLRQGESALLWSAPGQGKTMLALSLALAVAGGGRLLGWSSPTPRKVVYVDGEMHIQDLRDRLVMLASAIDGCDLEEVGNNLSLICRQDQGDDVEFPDLAAEAGQTAILKAAAAGGAELVILDNLSTLADLADENDAGMMTPVLRFLMRLKRAGIACILVHHANKSGEAFRGSSKLATTFEVIIGLVKLDGRRCGDGTGFEVRWEKLRGKPDPSTRPMAATLEDDSAGVSRWQSAPSPGMEVDQLIEAVQSGLHSTQRALAGALGSGLGPREGFAASRPSDRPGQDHRGRMGCLPGKCAGRRGPGRGRGEAVLRAGICVWDALRRDIYAYSSNSTA